MMRLGDERGLTLVELLVTLVITIVVFGAVLSSLQAFQTNNRYDQLRNEAQDHARSAIDRLTGELRNVAAPSAGAAGALELAGAYNLVFQTVSASQVFGGQNASNQMRVRYCLDAPTATKETLWRQTQTWTTASAPTMPPATSCPSSAWGNQFALVSNVTNQINGQNRPLFIYGPAPATELAQIRSVKADLFINVNPSQKRPGESELSDGAFVRNALSPPIARFTWFQGLHAKVKFNASTSTDPNGQALSYQWFIDGSAISGATTQQYETPNELTKASHSFLLTVTDTAGLSSSTEQTGLIT
jgi:type II secretory pathway pseudopilin PulG